uniref:Uncharacterized protein n=1 Tax=Avena sativa TaxID=4498 RepID=A0ACD5VJC3_AVESA
MPDIVAIHRPINSRKYMAVCGMRLLVPSLISILMITAASDEAALLAFRAGLSNPGVLASWNSSTGFCSWEGVTCSRRRPTQVVALSLPFRGLAGTISPAIGNLTFLQMLNMSSNELYGKIPPSIGRLRRLQSLDLGRNMLSGMLPANLSFCTSLITLILQFNQLNGQIPVDIGNTLTHLQRLSLVNNTFTGLIPASLGNLSSLRSVHLKFNRIHGPIPESLGKLADLQILNFEGNRLSGVIPPSLYNLSSLDTFAVGGNKLHGNIPADIGNKFPVIQGFSLANNQFSGPIPSSITNLTTLKGLWLSQNRFSGFVPLNLGKLHSLVRLFLYETDLEANDREGWEFISSMANCSELATLLIFNNSFSGRLPSSIANLSTTLEHLLLSNNEISGPIPTDIGNLVGLSILETEHNFMSGVIPQSIGKLVNLVQLYLENNSFSGLIPPSIGNLTQLEWLLAPNNNLQGPIPANIGKMENLQILNLSMNYLNGSIPKEILGLTSLSSHLDLSYNSLSGPIPSEVGGLHNLNKLVLSGNHLSGEIPASIGSCMVLEFLLLDRNSFEGSMPQSLGNIKGLRLLNLNMNRFSGWIPGTLGSMRGLEELYLAQNNFSGPIPSAIQDLTMLSNMDVSFNNLQGEVPKGGVFRNLTYVSVAGNSRLCGGVPQLHLAPCSLNNTDKNKNGWSKSTRIALATAGSILLTISLIVFTHIFCKTGRQKDQEQHMLIEEKYQRVSYNALSMGTNGFLEANLLGKGRYGAVYKCTMDNDGTGTTVAVKVFNLQQSGSSRSFDLECEALRMVRHRSLIKIITCCSGVDPKGHEFKALVFEFMPNGSLEGWLHPKSEELTLSNTLSLGQRLDIAVDVVDAIEYLHNHSEPPIIHCDIKPSNILLAEDMSARVGDFGISKILGEKIISSKNNSNSTVGLRGTIGYVAPEYGEGSSVSTVGDVYSLGILLLEMFTGRSPTDDMFRDSLDLHKFVGDALGEKTLEIADSAIWLHAERKDDTACNKIKEFLVSIFRLGISCSKQQPRDRMLIRDAAVEIHAVRDEYLRFLSHHFRSYLQDNGRSGQEIGNGTF